MIGEVETTPKLETGELVVYVRVEGGGSVVRVEGDRASEMKPFPQGICGHYSHAERSCQVGAISRALCLLFNSFVDLLSTY